MPLSTETLNPNSNDEQIRETISAAITECMKEGSRDQKQCAAIAFETARKATGKLLDFGK